MAHPPERDRQKRAADAQAAAQKPTLTPVSVTTTSGDDGYPIQATQMMKFNGENWELQGEVVDSAS